jgi:hypothetical protein
MFQNPQNQEKVFDVTFITSPQQKEALDVSFALELSTCPMQFIYSRLLSDRILEVELKEKR